MARVGAVLRALRLTVARDQKSIFSLTGNNFFIVSILMAQEAGVFLYLLLALVMLVPLSTDPLQKLPASRLSGWPLNSNERIVKAG